MVLGQSYHSLHVAGGVWRCFQKAGKERKEEKGSTRTHLTVKQKVPPSPLKAAKMPLMLAIQSAQDPSSSMALLMRAASKGGRWKEAMANPCDSVALMLLAQSQPSSSHSHFEVQRVGVGPAVCHI